MAGLSKEYIVPILPRNLSDLLREREAADANEFTPGTIVVVDSSDHIVECDCSDLGNDQSDVESSVEVVWTDMTERQDVDGFKSDGTKFNRATVIPDDFTADVNESEIFASASKSPAVGDAVLKSLNAAGKLDAYSSGTGSDSIDDLVANNTNVDAEDIEALKVGEVTGTGTRGGSGFVEVEFNL